MKQLPKLLFLLLPLSILSCKKETISTVRIDLIETWNTGIAKTVKIRIKKDPTSGVLYESPIILFGGSKRTNVSVKNLEFINAESLFILELVDAANNNQVCAQIFDLRNSVTFQRLDNSGCDIIVYFTRYDKPK